MSETNVKANSAYAVILTQFSKPMPIYALNEEKIANSDTPVGEIPANTDVCIFKTFQSEDVVYGQVDYEGLYWIRIDEITSSRGLTAEEFQKIAPTIETLHCPARCVTKKANLYHGPGDYYYSQRVVQKGERFTANVQIGNFVMVEKTLGNNTSIHGFMKAEDLSLERPMPSPIEPENEEVDILPEEPEKKEGPTGYHPPVEAREATDQPIALLSFQTNGNETRLTDFLSSIGLSGSMETTMSVIHQNDEPRFNKYANMFPSILGLGCKYHTYLVVPEVDAIRLKKLFLSKGFRPTVHTMYN